MSYLWKVALESSGQSIFITLTKIVIKFFFLQLETLAESTHSTNADISES
jgi:hypothetical protein